MAMVICSTCDLGVGDLPDEDVAGSVYAAFGVGVEHWFPYQENWLRET